MGRRRDGGEGRRRGWGWVEKKEGGGDGEGWEGVMGKGGRECWGREGGGRGKGVMGNGDGKV